MTEIPASARYGIWNADTEQWTGEWTASDEEAADWDEGCARSGLSIRVNGVDGTDDQWLDELQI
jgi:hypothetical protein